MSSTISRTCNESILFKFLNWYLHNGHADIKYSAPVCFAWSNLSLPISLDISGKLTLTSENEVTVTEGAIGTAGFAAASSDFNMSIGNAVNTADVTTREGAEETIMTMDYALLQLDSIRSNIGSTQNQLESTIRNISVTQVNVAAAESQIRDVDFAAESANFAKLNILAQSGSYAMSQANAVQQNVMRLLQ